MLKYFPSSVQEYTKIFITNVQQMLSSNSIDKKYSNIFKSVNNNKELILLMNHEDRTKLDELLFMVTKEIDYHKESEVDPFYQSYERLLTSSNINETSKINSYAYRKGLEKLESMIRSGNVKIDNFIKEYILERDIDKSKSNDLDLSID